MTPFKLFLGILFLSSSIQLLSQTLVAESKEVKLMGCHFAIRAVADSEVNAWKAINASIKEIDRIERLISSWDPNSQTSEINRNAGIQAVKVDPELLQLIQRSIKISELTNGAFDISFASMDRIYHFDGKEKALPNQSAINEAKAKIDWKKIKIDSEASTVFLEKTGMKIGFGGIGKGYAANRAKLVMQKIAGVEGGIVNASGDLSIWGNTETAYDQWNIKIAHPTDIQKVMADLMVNNTAVVTSGDYEKYFTHNDKRYAHIIDPKSGLPTTGIKSVTIVCKDAELADALATSVFILGQEEGLFLVNQLHGVEALLVTDEDKLVISDHIKLNYN